MEKVVRVKIDLITNTPDGRCKLVLIEMGPWPSEQKEQNLHRLGLRIGDCVTAVVEGIVAQRFPATLGQPIIIQVDSYDTPRWDVEALLARLQNIVNTSAEIQAELKNGRYTSSILITQRWVDFNAEYARRGAGKKRSMWKRLKNFWGRNDS